MGEETTEPDSTEGLPADVPAADVAALDVALWDQIASAALLRSQPRFDETVLDAWCGDGAAALPTAALVGPGGRVDAIDPDEALVAVARERAGEHVPQLHVHVADPADWSTTGYDLVQCVLGLASCATPGTTAQHLASLVKPGGRLVLSLWAQDAFAPLDELARDALAAEAGDSDDAVDSDGADGSNDAGTPSVADETSADAVLPGTAGTLAALLHGLGLVDVRAEHVDRHLELAGDLAWQLVIGARRLHADSLDDEALARVRERFDAAVAERGITRVDVSTLIAVGRRPA